MYNNPIFTLSKGSEASIDNVRRSIEWNNSRRGNYNRLERYYLGDHDILRRIKASTLKNNRIVVNHCSYITDKFVGYLIGNPVDYRTTGDVEQSSIDALVEELKRAGSSSIDVDLAKSCSIYGRAYEYVYIDDLGTVKTAPIDVRNCVVAYDDTVEHSPLFAVVYEIDKNGVFGGGRVLTANEDIVLTSGYTFGERKEHKFIKVPIVEYKNNGDYKGDFENVISLVDAYNVLQSDRLNDKEQLVDAILLLLGFDISATDLESVDRFRMMKVPAKVGEADAKYITKGLVEADTDILRQSIEDNIHKISAVPNMNDEKFSGNSSGVALRYKLLDFELATKKKERQFEVGLIKRAELYMNYLAFMSKMTAIPVYDIDVVFKRGLPQNDFETSTMINNLQGFVDKETLISQLGFIEDASKTLERLEAEKEDMPELPEFGTDKTRQVEDLAQEQFVEKESGVLDKLMDLLKKN